MKTALVTTTINVPHVLKLYRRFLYDTPFYIAVDSRTPDLTDFAKQLTDCTLVDRTDWRCDRVIGRNSIQRRNLAILEALKDGAELIITIDDDNIPIEPPYYWPFSHRFEGPFSGIQVGDDYGGGGWFDPGSLQFPREGIDPVSQRGFPQVRYSLDRMTHVVDAPVGVAVGTILGDPDTSAVDRISRSCIRVHQVSELVRAGYVVHPKVRTVFHSQNTAFIRKLAPAMCMLSGVGRYDDIFASLICRRIMREHDLYAHFGKPFVWQQRNSHDLVKDLQAEVWGMRHVEDFACALDDVQLPDATVIEQVRTLYASHGIQSLLANNTIDAALAFLEDCEGIMK